MSKKVFIVHVEDCGHCRHNVKAFMNAEKALELKDEIKGTMKALKIVRSKMADYDYDECEAMEKVLQDMVGIEWADYSWTCDIEIVELGG